MRPPRGARFRRAASGCFPRRRRRGPTLGRQAPGTQRTRCGSEGRALLYSIVLFPLRRAILSFHELKNAPAAGPGAPPRARGPGPRPSRVKFWPDRRRDRRRRRHTRYTCRVHVHVDILNYYANASLWIIYTVQYLTDRRFGSSLPLTRSRILYLVCPKVDCQRGGRLAQCLCSTRRERRRTN